MSSRIRLITKVGGSYISGAQALKHMERYAGRAINTPQEAIDAAKMLKFRIWIFREPRGIRNSKSRYRKACQALGIAKRRKKPMDTLIPLVPQPDVSVSENPVHYQTVIA